MTTNVGTVTVEVGDATYHLPKLTRRECIDLANAEFERGRKALLQDLKDAGADSKLSESRLSEYRELDCSHAMLLRIVKSLEGSHNVINLSVGKMNGSRPKDGPLFELPLNDLMILAGQLVGFTISNEQANKGGPTQDDDGYDYEKNRPQ